MKGLFVTIVMFCIVACSKKGSNDSVILPMDKMQAVMWDIVQADVFTDQFGKKDSLKNPVVENMQLQNKIFAMHKTSRAQYYNSYEHYISHPDLFRVLLDSITAKGDRNRTKMMEQYHNRGLHR